MNNYGPTNINKVITINQTIELLFTNILKILVLYKLIKVAINKER